MSLGSLHCRVISIPGLKNVGELLLEGLRKREEGDPEEDHRQGVTLGDAFLAQDYLWFASWLPANEANLMAIVVVVLLMLCEKGLIYIIPFYSLLEKKRAKNNRKSRQNPRILSVSPKKAILPQLNVHITGY